MPDEKSSKLNFVHLKSHSEYLSIMKTAFFGNKPFYSEMITKAILFSLFLSFNSFCDFFDSDSGSTIIVESKLDNTSLNTLENAFRNHISNFQVLQSGIIISVLKDDDKGSRHQRIIVKLENGQTLLISHNIDIASRIPNPQKNKRLMFYGEYEWNNKGGVIHWTHRDPNNRHVDGWLEYEGKKYQ